jgi:branched-chain amino acid transport system ATP-binding protein
MSISLFFDILVGGLILGGLYALIAVGLGLQYGVARVLNVSHGEFIMRKGISLVPEGGKPFPDMTVQENLEIGAYVFENWKNREESLRRVYRIFPVLKNRTNQLASTLSGGERQMLAMGRSLMSRPKLCLFDEPSYGLAPIIVKQLFNFIKSLHDEGITVLIVEQNVRYALEIADRAYVLENGRIVLKGESTDLLQNDHVKKAYLGL